VEQVGSTSGRAGEPLGVAPVGDGAVVAGQQDRWDLAAVPRAGLGVDGVLEQTVLEGLLDERRGVAVDPRDEPSDGLDHGEHGHLAAVEDVVAEADD
jgi:hypothetical protein